MEFTNGIHLINIPFNVTPTIKRFVNVYLIIGKECTLIDTGINTNEDIINDYMRSIGKSLENIDNILLTHCHPDHMGSANTIKKISGARVFAPKAEAQWIEDIDVQFSNRPIPNFYNLVGSSVKITNPIEKNDIIKLDDNNTILCIDGSGHSKGQIIYYHKEKKVAFCADSIPVKNDLPIYINKSNSIKTINTIKEMDINYLCAAWDKIRTKDEINTACNNGLSVINELDEDVKSVFCDNNEEIVKEILKMEKYKMLGGNPLFKATVLSHINELK